MNTQELIKSAELAAESWSADQILRWAFRTFGEDLAIASAFGVEGMVTIDLASRIAGKFRVFTIDTEFFFPETYSLIERVEQKYGIEVERAYPLLSPEEQERKHGPALWTRNPDQCCEMRKVEPLRRKLSGLRAWISSIRRDQTAQRTSAPKISWDTKFGLVKINPLADWTERQVWSYIHQHQVPYNPLHDQGYPSIGCTHCTRAVRPGEDSRAGRWSGFTKTECGLHVITPAAAETISTNLPDATEV